MQITIAGVKVKDKSFVIETEKGEKYYIKKSDTPLPLTNSIWDIEVKANSFKDDKGNYHTLNWIKSFKSLDGKEVAPKQPEKQPETAPKPPEIDGTIVPTDWNAKERRELRKTIWNATFMTVYPLHKGESIEEICALVCRYAEAGFAFTTTKKDDIEF